MINTPPSNFHLKSWDNTSVTLAWKPKASRLSRGYNIYRVTTLADPEEKINTDLIPQPESLYQDVALTLGQTYYYTITSLDTNYQESNRSLQLRITTGQPSTPTALVAQKEGCDIKLGWSRNPSEENVVKCRIYRKEPEDIESNLIDSVTTDTFYVDTTITQLGTFHYQITAVNQLNLESFFSKSVSADFELSLSTPSGFKVSSWLGTKVTLSWSNIGGTSRYNIYRLTTPELSSEIGSPINPTPIAGSSYQDSNLTEGISYFYVITRMNECGIESQPSPQVEFLAGRPQTPLGMKAEVKDCHIVIHWKPSTEGDVRKNKLYDYVIEQGGNQTLVLMDSVKNDTIYTEPSTNDSLYHRFKVVAIDTLGLGSFSSAYDVGGPFYPPPVPPALFKIVGLTDTSITFQISRSGVQSYNIYRSTISNKYDQPRINSNPIPSNGSLSVQYTYCTKGLRNEKYFFNATCIRSNACGMIESKMDNTKEVSFVFTHASVAALDLSSASLFPNPFEPYRGHKSLTFDGLTAFAKIEIFTITGDRVCVLEESDGDGKLSWDVTNPQGKKLASGVYIYRITNQQGEEKISKFAVIH